MSSRRQLAGAQESAIETTLLIKYIVSHARFATIHELIAVIKAAGRRLVEAQPKGDCGDVGKWDKILMNM